MFDPQILNYLLLRSWPFPRRLLTPKLAPGSILLSPPNVGLRYYCVHSELQHAVSDSLWTVPHKSALLDEKLHEFILCMKTEVPVGIGKALAEPSGLGRPWAGCLVGRPVACFLTFLAVKEG